MDSKNTGPSGATQGTAPSARAHHAGDGGAEARPPPREWCDKALMAAESALKERERDARDDEIARLQAKVDETTMANELLYAKIDKLEGGRPLARAAGE